MKTCTLHSAVAASGVLFTGLFCSSETFADGCSTPSFAVARPFDAGPNPASVTAGDFNGDGKPDLAVANTASGNVSVLLGNGDGSFSAPISYAVGTNPASIAAGDFNGDGKLDLAVANQGKYVNGQLVESNVSVLLGNGDGTFQAAINSSLGTFYYYPVSMVAGDLNGDGRPDLVLTHNDGFTVVSVLLGRGDGTFQDAVRYGTGLSLPPQYPQGKYSVAISDLNRDGKLDLVVSNPGSIWNPASAVTGRVSVLLGNGDGSFQPAVVQNFLPAFPYSVAVGDFNGDGNDDLAVANFGKPMNMPDFSGVSVLLGNGDGTFQNPVNYAAGTEPDFVVVGDFNGDGLADLTVANQDGVSVLLGKGDGTFQAAVNFAAGGAVSFTAVGDFNGDGRPDLALAVASGSSSVLLNTCGSGSGCTTPGFAAPRSVQGGPYPASVAIGDCDGDGKLDLAVVYQDKYVNGQLVAGTVSLLMGNGDGSFRTAIKAADRGGNALTFGDFNGDGKVDLAVVKGGSDGSTVSVLFGKGDGTFQFAADYPVGVLAVSVAIGDFNGDGQLDLAVVNQIRPNNVSVLLNKGDGTFQAAVNYLTGYYPWSTVVADFNGDGKLDLAVTSLGSWDSNRGYVNSGVSVLTGRGDGTFQAAIDYAAGTSPSGLAMGDFNGDGKPDLAVAVSGGVALLLGNGDGTFRAVNDVADRSGPLEVGDFNGDGKADLVVADGFDPVLMGRGDGTFGVLANLCPGAGGDSVTVGDFNGDGRPDLLVHTSSGNLSVQLNTNGSAGIRLLALRSDNTVKISWPLTAAGLVLESTTSLSLTNWQSASGVAATNNGRLEVSVLLNQQGRYFRLRKP